MNTASKGFMSTPNLEIGHVSGQTESEWGRMVMNPPPGTTAGRCHGMGQTKVLSLFSWLLASDSYFPARHMSLPLSLQRPRVGEGTLGGGLTPPCLRNDTPMNN